MDYKTIGFADELTKVAEGEILYPALGALAMGLAGRAGGRALGRRSGASYAKGHGERMKDYRKLQKLRGSRSGFGDMPSSPDIVTGMRQDIGGKAGGAAGAILGIAAGGKAAGGSGPGFTSTLKLNPKKDELNKAFALYKQETGKEPKTMSYGDINKYVKKVRGQ